MPEYTMSKDLVNIFTGCEFTVSVDYIVTADLEMSIESYDIEGDNISREELVEMFGEEQVKQLEEQIQDE